MPTLTTLPDLVAQKLLNYMDVDTLESLSATCCYFDELISGRFLTSIDFPLPQDFISEVASTRRLEKKPLLKLRYKKTDKELWKIILDLVHHSIQYTTNTHLKYMLQSQLCLFSLDKIRELDLVPGGLSRREAGVRMLNTSNNWKYENVDYLLLHCIESMGSLEHVTRLDIFLYPRLGSLQHHFILLPSLIELGLTILESQDMSTGKYEMYLDQLEKVVASSNAPVLKLTVVEGLRKKRIKELKNNFVERLVVEGPCTLMLVPVMENLKVVEVKLDLLLQNSCTYWRSRFYGDMDLHRSGLCCVKIGTMFDKCPKLETFMGLEVGSINKKSFDKWSLELGRKFYQDYLNQGGSKEFESWVETRWFSRKKQLI